MIYPLKIIKESVFRDWFNLHIKTVKFLFQNFIMKLDIMETIILVIKKKAIGEIPIYNFLKVEFPIITCLNKQ